VASATTREGEEEENEEEEEEEEETEKGDESDSAAAAALAAAASSPTPSSRETTTISMSREGGRRLSPRKDRTRLSLAPAATTRKTRDGSKGSESHLSREQGPPPTPRRAGGKQEESFSSPSSNPPLQKRRAIAEEAIVKCVGQNGTGKKVKEDKNGSRVDASGGRKERKFSSFSFSLQEDKE
jgi:hypothetical protein